MTTTDGETVHPDTPEWFIPYWEKNERQHGELRAAVEKHGAEIAQLRVEITNIPQRVIERL